MKSLLPLLSAISHQQQDLNISRTQDNLIDFAINAGMGAYLKYSAENIQQTISAESYQRLLSADLTAKVITYSILNSLKEVLAFSEQCEDDIILLKGISHCQRYYPHPWFRIMSDIDLLVSEKDVATLENILLKLGYQQTSKNTQEFYTSHHHSMPFYNKKNNLWIEVHSHLFSKSTPAKHDELFTLENIQTNTVAMYDPEYNCNIKQLSTELHLIYTCVHWADDFNTHKSCIQLTDIVLMILNNNTPLNWEKMSNWLTNTASASSVFLALSYLNKSSIIKIPDTYFNRVKLKHSNMATINRLILYKIIDDYFSGKKDYGRFLTENNLLIIWTTLLQPRSSLNNILRLPVNILFPPDNDERFKISLIAKRIIGLFRI